MRDSRRPARVLVLGTGAMGSLLAARLARGGAARVSVAGTWAEGLEAIRTDGITVEDETGPWSVRVATTSLSEAGPADFVLVLVKSTRTAAVAGTAARALRPRGTIVSLQNGLGNREVLARAAGAGRVTVGVATLGATLLGPGRVRPFPGRIVLAAPALGSVSRLALAFARTAGNRSSMLQDLERGAVTEIDALCGAVITEGRRLGVPTPVNEDLWREVREREGRPLVVSAGAAPS